MIYGLVDPRSGVVRYVGRTENPSSRFREHTGITKTSPKLGEWIADLRLNNLTPIFTFIDSVPKHIASESELKWIKHFDAIYPLLNTRIK